MPREGDTHRDLEAARLERGAERDTQCVRSGCRLRRVLGRAVCMGRCVALEHQWHLFLIFCRHARAKCASDPKSQFSSQGCVRMDK